MEKVEIKEENCKQCGYCIENCPKEALSFGTRFNEKGFRFVQIDRDKCVVCGTCYLVCPDYVFTVNGEEDAA